MFYQRLFTCLTACIVFCSVANVFAFDGNRQGFLLGLGGGLGMTSFSQKFEDNTSITESDTESNSSFVTDLKIGWGLNEQTQIYYTSKVSWFSIENAFNDNVTISSGVAGLGFSYFLEPETPSMYVTGAFGFSGWDAPFEENTEPWTGLGLAFGCGYEFSKHWSIEGNFTWGNPGDKEDDFKISANATTFMITISGLAY